MGIPDTFAFCMGLNFLSVFHRFTCRLLSGLQTIYNLAAYFKEDSPVSMNKNSMVLAFILFMVSCSKPMVEKPEVLIGEAEMIDMIVDIHLSEASFNIRRNRDTLVENSSSVNFYYAVLEKYQVPDSVFELSLVYYASRHRRFEKMYREAINKLNEMSTPVVVVI